MRPTYDARCLSRRHIGCGFASMFTPSALASSEKEPEPVFREPLSWIPSKRRCGTLIIKPRLSRRDWGTWARVYLRRPLLRMRKEEPGPFALKP